jgi:predicted Zn-dependent peptidase
LPLRTETIGAHAGALVTAELHDLGPDHLARQATHTEALSLTDLRGAADRHLHPDRLTRIVVGPKDAVLSQLEELGPVQVLSEEDLERS